MQISMYGVMISLGVFIAYCVSVTVSRHSVFRRHIDSVILWMIIPAILCARALFVLYHLDYFFLHPFEIPAVWHGGWVWHGGLAGGLLGIFLYGKKTGISFFGLLDCLAPGVAFGQAIGRWGNFFNQEAYGLPTNVPWGIFIDPAHRLVGFQAFSYFHPTFFYESVVDAVIGSFLIFICMRMMRRGLSGTEKAGVIFFLYLFLYSSARFFIEFLRIDAVPVFWGLRAPQWISIGMIGVAIYGLQKRKMLLYYSKIALWTGSSIG